MTDIDWRVLKSNADAERAQLNRILADIRDTINTSAESTLLQANATSTLTTEQGLSGMASAWRDTNARVTRNGNNITALAEDITFLSARVDDLDEDIYGEAGVIQLLSARVDSNEDGITANANSLLRLGALTPDGSSFLLNQGTVLVTPSQSLGQWRNEIDTTFGELEGSVQEIAEVRADLDEVESRYSVTVNANGVVTGISLLSGSGGTSNVRIQSDVFEIVNSSGVLGYSHNNGISIWRRGGYMTVIGPGFGANNEFTYWYGPNQTNLNNCTRATGIRWDTVNGISYTRGALFSGTISNGGYTTSLAATSFTTGTFGSNGGPIAVNASFSYSRRQDAGISGSGKNTITVGSGTTRATIELWRKVGSGAFSLVASNTEDGSLVVNSLGPDVEDRAVWNNTVSISYTDNLNSTQDREYEVRLILNQFQNISISGPAPVPAPENSLSLGVVTSE